MKPRISAVSKRLTRVSSLTPLIALAASAFWVLPPHAALARQCGGEARAEPCDLPAYGGPGGGAFRTLQGSLEPDGQHVKFSYVQPQLNVSGYGRVWLEGTVDKLSGRFFVNGGNGAVSLLEGQRK